MLSRTPEKTYVLAFLRIVLRPVLNPVAYGSSQSVSSGSSNSLYTMRSDLDNLRFGGFSSILTGGMSIAFRPFLVGDLADSFLEGG